MLAEYGFLAEQFITLFTLIWRLTGMDADMLIQDGALSEAARTIRTRERFFIGMDANVLREMGLLAKAFAAFGAPERPCVVVDPLVLQQRALLLEVFATRETLEQSQIRSRIVLGRTMHFHSDCVHLIAWVQQVWDRKVLEVAWCDHCDVGGARGWWLTV